MTETSPTTDPTRIRDLLAELSGCMVVTAARGMPLLEELREAIDEMCRLHPHGILQVGRAVYYRQSDHLRDARDRVAWLTAHQRTMREQLDAQRVELEQCGHAITALRALADQVTHIEAPDIHRLRATTRARLEAEYAVLAQAVLDAAAEHVVAPERANSQEATS